MNEKNEAGQIINRGVESALDEKSENHGRNQERKVQGTEKEGRSPTTKDRLRKFKNTMERMIRALDEHSDNEEFINALLATLEEPLKMMKEIEHVKQGKHDPRTYNFQSPLARLYFD